MNASTEKTDRALIERIQSGETEAYRSLIERYQRLVWHLVHRMIPNCADQEDISQDVFLKVYQHLSGFRYQCRLSTWIAQITYNTCLNYLKKKRTALFDDETPDTLNIEDIPGEHLHPEEQSMQRELAGILQDSIRKLGLRQRTVVTLYHLDGMSYQEISTVLALSESSVKSDLFRARQHLKKQLLKAYTREAL